MSFRYIQVKIENIYACTIAIQNSKIIMNTINNKGKKEINAYCLNTLKIKALKMFRRV
jgi:hypothetical protein